GVGVWLRRGRPELPRGMLIAGVAGAVVFTAGSYWIAHHYLYIADHFPASRRSPHEVAAFSGPLKVFLSAPEENWVWGAATAGIRDSVTTWQEKTLFPGAIILILAVAGLTSTRLPKRLRIGLGIGTVAIFILELGFRQSGGILWPYRLLYDLLPGWDAIRTPGRLATFSSLTLALLAAAGAEAAIRAGQRRRWPAWSAVAVAGVLSLALVSAGRGPPLDPLDNPAPPPLPPSG